MHLKKKDLNHGHHVNLTFARDGKLNVSFDYIDWVNTEFDQLGRENYYMYKSLVFYQKRNMKWKKFEQQRSMLKSKSSRHVIKAVQKPTLFYI